MEAQHSHFLRRLTKRFQTFANETSMHGFKDLSSSNRLSTKIFWFLVLTLSVAMTGLHICQAVKDFARQETTMLIQPAKDGDIILLPDLKICYPHWTYWVDFDRAKRLGFSKEATLCGLSYLDVIYSSHIFNVSEVHQEFVTGMKANNFKKLDEFYLAIINERSVDVSIRGFQNEILQLAPRIYYEKGYSQLCMVSIELQLPNTAEKKFSDNQIVIYIKNKSFKDIANLVDYSEFRSYLNQNLKRQGLDDDDIRLSAVDNSMSIQISICPIGNIAFGSSCFQISNSLFQTFVFVTGNVYNWKNSLQRQCIQHLKWISPNNTCNTICDSKYNKVFQRYQIPINDVKLFMDNKIDIVFLSMDKKETYFKNESYIDGQNRSVYFTDYLTLYNTVESQVLDCYKRCVAKGCTEYRYKFMILQKNLEDNRNFSTSENFVSIEYQDHSDILVTTEVNVQTWENFVGSVGGLLGIWTGASILSFVQTIYLCCCSSTDNLLVCTKCRCRKCRARDESERDHIRCSSSNTEKIENNVDSIE